MLLEMRNDDATTLTTREDLGEERGEFYDDDDEFGAWWCDHIEEAKYVSPAILGDRIRVESTVIAENISDDEREKSWVVKHLIRKMGGDDDDDDDFATTTVSFTCQSRYRSRRGGRKSSNWDRESSDSASSSGSGGSSSSSRSETDRRRATNIRFFASELNHRSVWHVDVLRWFERNRTDLIGGPKALESLKSEDECVVVVSSISNVTIFTDVIEDMIVQSSRGAHPSSLLSFSSVRFLRRDVQCEFDQRVVGLADAPNDDLRVVASGKITCTVLKRENMRPRKSPRALKERLLVA
jgi:acyl-CoA thioesterase FadM